MDLATLIEELSDPDAYPDRVDAVEVRQTHISVVFLAGEHVYKIKKPVQFAFVDFSTLARRRHFCQEEVRLNARLAPEVYLGIVPIVRSPAGLKVDERGEAIEWAVKMKRLDDAATLESRLARGAVSAVLVESVARRIAAFHARAETSERIAAFGRFDAVARNARENLEQSRVHVGQTIRPSVFARLEKLLEEKLAAHRALIESRAGRGVTRDTHGDLRLDHVYAFDDTGHDLTIIDCIEFNEQFRFADPVADVAFLAMDFKFEGRPDLARVLADAYFAATCDDEGRALLPFYISYRAAVRAKVEGFKQAEAEVPTADRADSLERARGYWLLALGELEPPEEKPCLLLVGGLPGSGKSTLAADLERHSNFHIIRSDVVRKELAAAAGVEAAPEQFGSGIYSAKWNDRTYAECLRRAAALLFEGQRVLVDASFREESRRRAFLAEAARWRVPALLLVCEAAPDVIRARLAARTGDVSDADWSIYLEAANVWQEPSPATRSACHAISTAGTREQSLAQALVALRASNLAR